MLRVYLDSNVFRYIKPQHPSYNKELHSLMDALIGEVLFIYSGAHLDDLKMSVDPYREEDLKLMEKYVNTNYFSRDPIKNITQCGYVSPSDAFKQIDYNTMDQTLNNFDLNTIFKDFGDSDESKSMTKLLESIFNTPLADFGPTADTSKMEDAHREWFAKMLPNYSPQMSIKEFINSFMQYAGKLFNDSKEVSELRKYIEAYMQSDSYSYKLWGMGFNEKLKDKHGKSFLEMIDSMLAEKQKDNLFLRFQSAYSLLEMYNITKETVGGKTKKFNYWSLHNDATHCYFASLCDCLVTDDKGLQAKAQIMYNLFGIPTMILSTSDFVALTEELLRVEKTTKEFLDRFVFNLNNSYFISAKTIIDTRETVTYYELAQPHFNVFPFLERVDYPSGSSRFILTLLKEQNEIPLLKREVELISKKIYRVLGQDRDKRGEFKLDEELKSGLLRTWMLPSMFFQLAVEQEGDGTFLIKLYIDVHFEK
jgi:hypothetical protein